MTIAAAGQSETVKEEGGGVKRTCDLLVPLLSVSLCTKTVEEGGRVQECMNLLFFHCMVGREGVQQQEW